MTLHMPRHVIALTALCLFSGAAFGQTASSAYLKSVEWLAVDADRVVRGVIVDVDVERQDAAADWNGVTVEVKETLSGARTERVRFVVSVKSGSTTLKDWQKSKQEVLCFLVLLARSGDKHQELVDRFKTDLYAYGQNYGVWMSVLSLAPNPDGTAPLTFTADLKLARTPEELLQRARSAIAERARKAPTHISLPIPAELAAQTGCSGQFNRLILPQTEALEGIARQLIDDPAEYLPRKSDRLANQMRIAGTEVLALYPSEKNQAIIENLGRRFIQTPGDFLSGSDETAQRELRFEGAKILSTYKSQQNLALLRAWLDDAPLPTAIDANDALLPRDASAGQSVPVRLPADLTAVPEIHFQKPLVSPMTPQEARLRLALTIDLIESLNRKKTDGFMEALTKGRADLAGLPIVMGDACRMQENGRLSFIAARDDLNTAFNRGPGGRISFDPEPQPKMDDPFDRYAKLEHTSRDGLVIEPSTRVATLTQMLGADPAETQLGLAKYLQGKKDVSATRALARLAIFSPEAKVRQTALEALRSRPGNDYDDIIDAGLKYPWPEVAERAAAAIVELERNDLLPRLVDVLDRPDPRTPGTAQRSGKQVSTVRELVRINHNRNCLLCHAPARDDAAKAMSAQIPLPGEAIRAYYSPTHPDILVRFDVTYLRQDFSLNLGVARASAAQEMQRYDFVVRTREVTENEAAAYRKLLADSGAPYHRSAHEALCQLTGLEVEPTAAAWRKALGL